VVAVWENTPKLTNLRPWLRSVLLERYHYLDTLQMIAQDIEQMQIIQAYSFLSRICDWELIRMNWSLLFGKRSPVCKNNEFALARSIKINKLVVNIQLAIS
jgi:hypothetical protein